MGVFVRRGFKRIQEHTPTTWFFSVSYATGSHGTDPAARGARAGDTMRASSIPPSALTGNRLGKTMCRSEVQTRPCRSYANAHCGKTRMTSWNKAQLPARDTDRAHKASCLPDVFCPDGQRGKPPRRAQWIPCARPCSLPAGVCAPDLNTGVPRGCSPPVLRKTPLFDRELRASSPKPLVGKCPLRRSRRLLRMEVCARTHCETGCSRPGMNRPRAVLCE